MYTIKLIQNPPHTLNSIKDHAKNNVSIKPTSFPDDSIKTADDKL